jgi:arsenate reductase (thioredoxin)
MASEVMKEAGIDISSQKTKSVAQSLKEPFGHVITICDTTKERNPIFRFALGVLHWNIIDPLTGGELLDQKEVFRRVRDKIQERLNSSWPIAHNSQQANSPKCKEYKPQQR